MKIYNVVISKICYDDYSNEVFSFENKCDAQKKLQECYQGALDNHSEQDNVIIYNSEDRFEICKPNNHIFGNISSTEVEQKCNFASSYWEREVFYQVNHILNNENDYDEELVKKLKSFKYDEMNEMLSSIASDILEDDWIWDTVNSSIQEYIEEYVED